MTQHFDCRECPDPKACRGHTYSEGGESVPWYTIGEIRFCRYQMVFLISELAMLESGHYPPDPRGSSYIDPAVKTKRKRSYGGFEKPVELAAEVKLRLEHAGWQGTRLRKEIMDGCSMSDLEPASKVALWYVSGKRRKWDGYEEGQVFSLPFGIHSPGRWPSRLSQ